MHMIRYFCLPMAFSKLPNLTPQRAVLEASVVLREEFVMVQSAVSQVRTLRSSSQFDAV